MTALHLLTAQSKTFIYRHTRCKCVPVFVSGVADKKFINVTI